MLLDVQQNLWKLSVRFFKRTTNHASFFTIDKILSVIFSQLCVPDREEKKG